MPFPRFPYVFLPLKISAHFCVPAGVGLPVAHRCTGAPVAAATLGSGVFGDRPGRHFAGRQQLHRWSNDAIAGVAALAGGGTAQC